jgi:hypothetical protein
MVADGTILAGIRGPADVNDAKDLISDGYIAGERIGHHRLTVFAAFYAGNPEELREPEPDVADTWAAIATRTDAVTEQLQSLIDAGADALILEPIGQDPAGQLRLAAAEIVPDLIRVQSPTA